MFLSEKPNNMNTKSMACLVGGGIGSLAAAAFIIRDGNFPRANISILEAAPILFMPRMRSDRPLPVPRGSRNLSQFVELPDDVVFTVEYSVRAAAQMAVYQLLGIDRKIPPVPPYAKSLHAQFDTIINAFK
jgi:myosin-crossreactive antigen